MGDIADYLKARDLAWSDKTPLERPVILDDPKAKPEEKLAAEELYASSLLNRKSLTEAEQKWLGGRISECLRGMKG